MTEKRRTTASLTSAKRLIVKIGSALLVDEESGGIRRKWLDASRTGTERRARGCRKRPSIRSPLPASSPPPSTRQSAAT